MLTKTQINEINKAMNSGTGVDIKISKTQIRKAVHKGGSLWSTLFSVGAKAISKVAPALDTEALSALDSLGIDKIFGKGIDVPFPFLSPMLNLRNELTKRQTGKLMKGLQSGSGIVFKPTKKQINGGFLGTLAAVGITMAIDLASKLFGSGLHVGNKSPGGHGKGMHVGPKPGNLYPYYPPPFLGSWGGEGQGLLLGKNSPFNNIPVVGDIL